MLHRSFVLPPTTAIVILCVLFTTSGCTPPDEPPPTGKPPAPEKIGEPKEAPAEKVEEIEKAPPPEAKPEVHIREGAERIDLEREMICTFRKLVFVRGDPESLATIVRMTGEICKALFGVD